MSKCPSGKEGFGAYADALAHLEYRERGNGRHGFAYVCPTCDEFHVTTKPQGPARKKGRGKSRRGVVKGRLR